MLVIKNYNKDELLQLVSELPISTFGYREFEAYQNATNALVAKDYPESMQVIDIQWKNENDGTFGTVALLYSDTKDQNFKRPVFIG